MRFLILSSDRQPHLGGKSGHIANLTRGLIQLGHQIQIVSRSAWGAWLDVLLIKAPGYTLKRLLGTRAGDWPWWVNYRLTQFLLAGVVQPCLVRSKFDAISVQDVSVANVLARLPRTQACPVILTVHGDQTNEFVSMGSVRRGSRVERWFWDEEQRGYRSVDRILTVDSRLRAHVYSVLGSDSPRPEIQVMHNFVDVDQFRPLPEPRRADLRRHWGLDESAFTLLCPRRLTPKNGVLFAVEALVHLPEKTNTGAPIMLLLAGEGSDRRRIEALIKREKLEKRVRFLGNIDHAQMPELYAAAHIVLIPSVPSAGVVEATSLSALEALACQVPVVASAVGGIPEIVENGRTGLLVPPGDPRALADAISLLAQDTIYREGLASQGRSAVLERHSHLQAADRFARFCSDG